MKNSILIAFVCLLCHACINNSKPLAPDNQPIHPEAFGTPNSEQQGAAFTISTTAFYQASINSSTSPGQVISLTLTPKREAEMTTDNKDKGQVWIDKGVWTTLGNGNLRLNLVRTGEKDSTMLEFKTDGEKLVYTGSEYGTAGLVLWVKPIPQ
ncbi:MAG: hypothetical protein ACKVOW_17185 [Chitinophagaceae bacterium]